MARQDKKRYGWLWAGALFFSATYLVTALGIPPAPPAARTTTAASAPTRPATREAGATPPGPIRSPVYAIAILVALTMPYGARARGMLGGALRGLWAGATGAMGIGLALGGLARRIGPEALTVTAVLTGLTTLICCAATGAAFAFIAERRRRQLYGNSA